MKENKAVPKSHNKENELLRKQLAQKEAELAIIGSVSEAISKQLDINTITKIIGDKVRDIFNSEVTEILLLDELTNMIHIPYSFYREYQTAEPFELGEGLTSKVIKSGKPLVVGTFEESLRLGVIIQSEEEKTETYIGVPIIVNDKVIGVVSIQSYIKNDFNDEKVRLLQILSTNMGVALQNARLFEETNKLLKETEQRTAELAIINSVGEAMSKQLDVLTVTKIVGDKVREIFKAEVTEILLLDHDTGIISVPYSYYNGYQTVETFQLGEGLTTKVIDSRKPLLLLNKEDQNEHGAIVDESVGEADLTESYLGVPILFSDKILCVVSVQSYEKNAYNENNVRLLSTLSTNMGVTLQNAKLFEETKKLLNETEQRTAELAVINSVQEGLAKELDIKGIYELVVNKKSGIIISYIYNGTELIKDQKVFRPTFWRAPTDNDYGWQMPKKCLVWKNASESELTTKTISIKQNDDGSVSIGVNYEYSEVNSTWTTEYIVFTNGIIKVKNTFITNGENLPVIPRIGMKMMLPSQFKNVEYFGRGPIENYWDRNYYTNVGRYKSTVKELYVPYIRPQENGHRADTKWLAFYYSKNCGVLFIADSLIEFNALNNTIEDFDAGPDKEINLKHTYDIVPRDLIELHVDYKMIGVGGDDSWGATPHKEYSLFPSSNG